MVFRIDIRCAHCGHCATVEIEDGQVLSAVCDCDEAYYNICPSAQYALIAEVRALDARGPRIRHVGGMENDA